MQRLILVAMTIASVILIGLTLGGAIEVDGLARVLVIVGAAIIALASIDDLRMRAAKTAETSKPAKPVPATATATAAAPVKTEPAATKPTVKTEPAVTKPTVTKPTVTKPTVTKPTVAAAPVDLTSELVARGQLSTTGPITDHDAETMVMVAVHEGAIPTPRPRLRALPGQKQPEAAASLPAVERQQQRLPA